MRRGIPIQLGGLALSLPKMDFQQTSDAVIQLIFGKVKNRYRTTIVTQTRLAINGICFLMPVIYCIVSKLDLLREIFLLG